MTTTDDLDALTAAIADKHGALKLWVHLDAIGDLVLDNIVIAPEHRNAGTATDVMNTLTAFADEHHLRMALTPTSEFGSSISRLRGFYKRFGFTDNSGRTRDYATRQAMLRNPATQNL